MTRSRSVLATAILLYFVMALEVLVMVSPFAAFFYAVFNPVLLYLARWQSTRWLAGFFLPHMVMPPGVFLKVLRVTGSVLFVGGALVFLVCAGQVYFHKLARRGPALGGLYAWVRHPQYVALTLTGLGLAILWPRILTLLLWTVMMAIYYALARDEERRMLGAFGEQYRSYMARTGMFLPRRLEALLQRVPCPRAAWARPVIAFGLFLAFTLGGALALRAYTVSRLPLWSEGRVSVLPVLAADAVMLQHRMSEVLEMPEVASRLPQSGPVLGYFVPVEYVMQGMIADTDPAFRLYEHHRTMPMIADWIFHPFRHLEGAHGMAHHLTLAASPSAASQSVRRIIFIQLSGGDDGENTPSHLFALGATRVPEFFVDVDVHTLTLLKVQELGPGTGWGRVPTPMF